MVPVNDWTITTRDSKRVSVTGLGDKRDTFSSNKCPFLNWLYLPTYSRFCTTTKKDTKKCTMAKRVGQITPMCDPKITRAYCCTKPNWIGSSRFWNNRPRPHSLGLLAYIFAALKKSQEDIFAGRYFREKIFSREDIFAGFIFAGRYYRGKIFSREQYIRENIFSRKYFKLTFRENFFPRK